MDRMNPTADHLKNFLPVLLGPAPTRSQVAGLPRTPPTRTFHVDVHRTMPFELCTPVADLLLSLWDAGLAFHYSDYDPALTQLEALGPADLHLFWLDWRIPLAKRIPAEVVDWAAERIGRLQAIDPKPVLLNNWPSGGPDAAWATALNALLKEKFSGWADFHLVDLAALPEAQVPGFFDDRNDQIFHFPFSNAAAIAIGRHLGSRILPILLGLRVKAVVTDLDNTLYSGILGEDGIAALALMPGHRRLQEALLELKRSGTLLCVNSRNDAALVEELFRERRDFPLKAEDLAFLAVDWETKSAKMGRIIEALAIDSSTILFLDDNPAELIETGNAWPSLKLLWVEPSRTADDLRHYPGLSWDRSEALQADRTKDIQANRKREEMKQRTGGGLDYLASLGMVLHLSWNDPAQAGRLQEMSQKFNQFNLGLARLNQAQAKESLGPGFLTLVAGLNDLFADSGLIGALVGRLDGKTVVLEEVLFSCRILGRGIEDLAFRVFLERAEGRGIEKVRVEKQVGPRNHPALDWIAQYGTQPPEGYGLKELLSQAKERTLGHPARLEGER